MFRRQTSAICICVNISLVFIDEYNDIEHVRLCKHLCYALKGAVFFVNYYSSDLNNLTEKFRNCCENAYRSN